jgi:hypothetical protein
MVPYTPQQNGVVERKNRSLKEMASCMLHAKSLPQRLWDEALNCATYIQNISPHRSVKDKTPYEAWSGLKLEVTHFRILVHVHGPGFPLRRGRHLIHRAHSVSLLDTPMV